MGSLDGVHSTHSLWAGSKEVVHVTYDPNEIEYGSLLKSAKQMECTSTVFTYDDLQLAAAKSAGIGDIVPWNDSLASRKVAKQEQKYYLRGTAYGYLPLSELQAVKANAMLKSKSNDTVEKILSPRQIQIHARIQMALEKDKDALKGLGFPLYGESKSEVERLAALLDYENMLRAKLDLLVK